MAPQFIKKLIYSTLYRIKKSEIGRPLLPEYFGLSIHRNQLVLDKFIVSELAEKYGTPLHIVSRQKMIKQYDIFLKPFRDRYKNTNIYLSYKTNPVPGLLKILHNYGAGAEVISQFELWLALRLGVDSQKIIYNGPCKTDDGLSLAIQNQIKMINMDSFDEIDKLDQLTRKAGRRQTVGLRVVTGAGWSSQFGFNIKSGEAFKAFEYAKSKSKLDVKGIHVHLGTGIHDPAVYQKAANDIAGFVLKLKSVLNLELKYFDFGGGYGLPSVANFTQFDRWQFSQNLPGFSPNPGKDPGFSKFSEAIWSEMKDILSGMDAEIMLEPGRAVMAAPQMMVIEIIAVKDSENGEKILIANGGKNISAPLDWEYHEMFAANKMEENSKNIYKIYGPLCHPNDIITEARVFPNMEKGDFIAIMDTGAYFIPNSRNFSFPRPGVILVDNDNIFIIRNQEQFENIISLDQIPE